MSSSLLLQKLARILQAYDSLSEVDSYQLHPIEDDLLDSLENYVMPLFDKIVEITDDVFNEHAEVCNVRKFITTLPEADLQKQPKSPTVRHIDEALALGTGLAVGGVFDYLRPEQGQVDGHTEHQDIECISEEELDELEEELGSTLDSDIDELAIASEVSEDIGATVFEEDVLEIEDEEVLTCNTAEDILKEEIVEAMSNRYIIESYEEEELKDLLDKCDEYELRDLLENVDKDDLYSLISKENEAEYQEAELVEEVVDVVGDIDVDGFGF